MAKKETLGPKDLILQELRKAYKEATGHIAPEDYEEGYREAIKDAAKIVKDAMD